jgi:hypothetical protein
MSCYYLYSTYLYLMTMDLSMIFLPNYHLIHSLKKLNSFLTKSNRWRIPKLLIINNSNISVTWKTYSKSLVISHTNIHHSQESGVFHFLSRRPRRLKMKFIYMPTVNSSSNVSKYAFNADPVRLWEKNKDLLLLILSDMRD